MTPTPRNPSGTSGLTRRALLAALALVAVPRAPAVAQGQAPVIAAAASLEFALPEIAEAFLRDTGQALRLVFGATGNLSRQIRQGAPFQMFLAADDATPLALHDAGLTRDAGRVYALGRLAFVAPPRSAFDPAEGIEGLARALATGAITRFAIANPDHAPFGAAAREVLIRHDLWDALRGRLVLGESVGQAAQFALSGNAEGGIIAASLAAAPPLAARGRFALIDANQHTPLRQRMVLMTTAGPVAGAFFDYLTEPAARDILTRHGFEPVEG